MPEVRFIGAILGLGAVVLGIAGLRRHHGTGILRVRDVVVVAVGAGLLVLAVFPRLFDAFAAIFGVSSLEGRRVAILTVLGFAVLASLLFAAVGRIGRLESEVGDLTVGFSSRTPVHQRSETYPDGFVAAIIPAYNEAASLPGVLAAMPEAIDGVPVISVVVSDGSTDETVEAATAHADVVLERPLRRGTGAAIRTGIAFALRSGASVLVTIDADGQHDPAEMASLVAPVLSGDVDVCHGTRIVNSKHVSGRSSRALGVSVFGWLMRSGGVADTSDPSNGYRSFSAAAYRRLKLTEDQFYVGEFIVRSSDTGLRVVEIPVTVSARVHGESKKPGSVFYGFGFVRGIVRAMTKQQPRK